MLRAVIGSMTVMTWLRYVLLPMRGKIIEPCALHLLEVIAFAATGTDPVFCFSRQRLAACATHCPAAIEYAATELRRPE
jgi:hypothetical protein